MKDRSPTMVGVLKKSPQNDGIPRNQCSLTKLWVILCVILFTWTRNFLSQLLIRFSEIFFDCLFPSQVKVSRVSRGSSDRPRLGKLLDHHRPEPRMSHQKLKNFAENHFHFTLICMYFRTLTLTKLHNSLLLLRLFTTAFHRLLRIKKPWQRHQQVHK